jgi:predicted acyltransferase
MKTNKPRLLSLDAFRGFTIAAMLLVNNPGDWNNLYPQLEHAAWSGWTFTDWIFPFFLFIGGVSMHISLGHRAAEGAQKLGLLQQLTKRAALIFLIGLALNLIPNFDFNTVRIPGVLQRIALCTLLAAPIVVYFSWRQQCVWIVAILTIYTLIMLYLPVPDINGVLVSGALEPGRDVGAWLDRVLMDGHLWKKAQIWDPEGVLSTLPATCSVLFGVLAGNFLSQVRTSAEKTVWMLLAGLACLWLGQILNSLVMPINKSLWTSSFCIFMTGWALIIFASFYWLLDGNSDGKLKETMQKLSLPFVMYGLNALFLFTLSGVVAKMLGFIHIAQADGSSASLQKVLFFPISALPITAVNASLLFAILFNLLMLSIACLMWKKRWFIKV